MPFTVPDLPYAIDALEPLMSTETLRVHHGKHHAHDVTVVNELTAGTAEADKPLETIVRETARNEAKRKLFNNAAEAWNHGFFWTCMKPRGGGAPEGPLAEAINAAFGGLADFKARFKAAAAAQFGSGWAWLVLDPRGRPAITTTANAGTPLAAGRPVLLACDVWEHAYYLDYQNRRADYVQDFLDYLVDWDAVAARYEAARAPDA